MSKSVRKRLKQHALKPIINIIVLLLPELDTALCCLRANNPQISVAGATIGIKIIDKLSKPSTVVASASSLCFLM